MITAIRNIENTPLSSGRESMDWLINQISVVALGPGQYMIYKHPQD